MATHRILKTLGATQLRRLKSVGAERLAPPSPPRLQSADRNVAVGSHGQYVPTLTAAAA